MNFRALINNVRLCSRRAATPADWVRLMVWTYSSSLPSPIRPNSFLVSVRWSEPVGQLKLRVRCNRGSDAFIAGEVFDHQYYRLPLPAAPATILDLGGNAGYTAIYFSRMYPAASVAVVEPVPANLAVLKENLQLNAPSVRVFEGAVSTEDDAVFMCLDRMDYGHRVGSAGHGRDGVQVRGFSVETLMGELGWDRIGLLKIDIEGYEKILLTTGPCAWLERVDALVVEIHDDFSAEDFEVVARRHRFSRISRQVGGLLLALR